MPLNLPEFIAAVEKDRLDEAAGRPIPGAIICACCGKPIEDGEHLHVVPAPASEPVWDVKTRGWSCPPGYAHPKCIGCGHNFFGSKPVLVEPERHRKETGKTYPTAGYCQWCQDERE